MPAAKKTEHKENQVELDEMPEPAAGEANKDGAPISTSANDFDLKSIAKGGEQSIGQLDLTEDEETELDNVLSEITPAKWVLAKFTGANGSPFAEHVQPVQGRKARFPLNRWVVVQYYFVLAARNSGYVDFVHNKGGKHMRRSDNKPVIAVQDAIPEQFQSPEGAMEFIDLVADKHPQRKRLQLACDSF